MSKTWLPSAAVILLAGAVFNTGCSSATAPPTTGSLQITVTPPPGAPAAITVSGPSGFNRVVSSTATLPDLAPGSYTITATNVVVSNATYGVTPSSITVKVVASTTPATASVSYAQISGSLQITVTPPPGAPAAITVVGPFGFNRVVSATTTLSNLAPGSYTITATNVVVSNATYAATASSIAVTVVASTTPATASVSYARISGSLTLTVSGLPTGTMAGITVSGPGGFNQTVTASQTLSNIMAGTYTIAASNVAVSSAVYAPTPASASVTVTASNTPAAASVAYALATGALSVTVSGLPTNTLASIVVTGPSGFSQAVTATVAFSTLVPGNYTITAANVVVASDNYGPRPVSQTVPVTASDTAATATVTYSVHRRSPFRC
jgi:hypothetical protein